MLSPGKPASLMMATSCKTRPLWMRCRKMPKEQVTECRSRDSGSSEEREQARQELALVSCRDPRAGYPEILRNVTLATEAEHCTPVS